MHQVKTPRARLYRAIADSLPLPANVGAVTGPNDPENPPAVYSGEVWTDSRRYATVPLPRTVGRLHGSLRYELRPFTPGVAAQIAAELIDGRFTIATDEPHVKVAWRVSVHLGARPERRERGRTARDPSGRRKEGKPCSNTDS